MENSTISPEAEFIRYRDRLKRLVIARFPAELTGRMSIDDVLQDAFASLLRKREAFVAHPEISSYIKLRTIVIQTLVDLERRNLGTARRDWHREIAFDVPAGENTESPRWNSLPASAHSPRTQLADADRKALVRALLLKLSDQDREILELRHFEGLSNAEVAAVLRLDGGSASARYVRALQRLRRLLEDCTEFAE